MRGRARIGELSRTFGVSETTIRKDLTTLQEQGLVKRTHGGVIALHPIIERELSEREITRREAKAAIARACLAMIRPGDSVFLDSGTTVGTIATAIRHQPALCAEQPRRPHERGQRRDRARRRARRRACPTRRSATPFRCDCASVDVCGLFVDPTLMPPAGKFDLDVRHVKSRRAG